MEYRALGTAGVKVSSVCLGTMTWGQQNSESDGHAQMDYALANGVNFFDTAEIYPIPPKPETTGATERIIGAWFRARKNRDKIVLATKITGRGSSTWLRDGGVTTELSAAQIREAVEKSLKRLQTDYIDLYQLHTPDRAAQLFGAGGLTYRPMHGPEHAIPEILDALEREVKAGKIRFIGLSNETPWGTMEFLHHARLKNQPRIRSVQNAYSLINRVFELGHAEVALRERVGLLAYSPLAQGLLTGKYRNGALPKGSRKALFDRLQRYERPESAPAIERYLDIAQRFGVDPAHLALKFVDTRPFVASTIIGATTMEQLKTDIAAFGLKWTEDLERAVDEAHHAQPNPAP